MNAHAGDGPLDDATLASAMEVLTHARLSWRGKVVGTVAACDPVPWKSQLNYRECFVRDFAVSAAAFLAAGEHETVGNFLTTVATLQADADGDAGLTPAPGLMPASFAVMRSPDGGERLVADFGQRAIGRVAPVDSALWWLWTLRAHARAGGDPELHRQPTVAEAVRRVLRTYLQPQFEMLPSLLVPDGASMIDRRLGVYGHPLDVQVLFWAALRSARELLSADDPWREPVERRLVALGRHLRRDYWLDRARIEAIRRLPVEEFGEDALNPWNLHPDAVPVWTMAWLSEGGGYFAGNVGPARLDPRFFALGNLLAVASGLATEAQATALFDLVERHEGDLLGVGGMKLVYPPVEGRDWALLTGSDPKNVPWAYHNGGSWPMLLWPLTSAARRAGRGALAGRVLQRSGPRLRQDDWPEYYDGPYGGLIGGRSRLRQTWSAAAVLAAAALRADAAPSTTEGVAADPYAFEPDAELEAAIAAASDELGTSPRGSQAHDDASS